MLRLPSLLLATAILASPAVAQQNGNIGVGQQQQQGQLQGQAQKQQQGQAQGQAQRQNAVGIGVGVAISGSSANSSSINAGNNQRQFNRNRQDNTQSTSLSNTNKFESRPGAPSVGGVGMGFGGAGSYGDRNACVMHRQQAWSLGGSVGVDSSGITGGGGLVGRGTTEMVLVVYCELGESARELQALGLHAAAHKLSCMHPYKRQAMEAVQPGMCDGVQVAMQAFVREDTEPHPPVTMVDATLPRETAAKADSNPLPAKTAATSWSHCKNGKHAIFDRCKSDFDTL